MMNDRTLLQVAVKIATEGIEKSFGPFGAVITKEGTIIAEAANLVTLSGDPTAHAEMLAIRKASEILKTHDLSDCTLYSSCEPCPMCLGAVYWAGIKKVVYASTRSEAAKSGFNDSLIYNELTLDPSKRKIEFIRYSDAGGEEVFRRWDEFEDKVRY